MLCVSRNRIQLCLFANGCFYLTPNPKSPSFRRIVMRNWFPLWYIIPGGWKARNAVWFQSKNFGLEASSSGLKTDCTSLQRRGAWVCSAQWKKTRVTSKTFYLWRLTVLIPSDVVRYYYAVNYHLFSAFSLPAIMEEKLSCEAAFIVCSLCTKHFTIYSSK